MNYFYENYTNYIYKVEDLGNMLKIKDNRYILFNPSLFKWMAIDDIGKELFEQIREHHDIEVIKKNMILKYNITEQIFNDDAIPFITTLFEEQYISTSKTSLEALWVKKTLNHSNIENYYFEDLYLSLSEHCNLRCQYCFNDKKRVNRTKGKPLIIEQIHTLLKEYKDIGGKGVVFTGGEPTLNNEFIDICKIAKEIGLRTTVITNGTLLDKFDVSDIVRYIDGLTLSIDSVDDTIQKELWNVNDFSYENNIKPFLEKLNNFTKVNSIKYNVFIMPVVNKKNMNCLRMLYDEISKILSNCNVKWVFSKYSNIGCDSIDGQLSISEEEYNSSLWNSFRGEKSDIDLLKYIMSRGGKNNLSDKPHKVSCNPAFFVTHYGDVYPCQGLEECDYLLGNISEKNLKTIFYEKRFQELLLYTQVDNLEYCNNCELRMYCSNECGRACIKEKDDRCKTRIVQRMYLKTL